MGRGERFRLGAGAAKISDSANRAIASMTAEIERGGKVFFPLTEIYRYMS